MKKPLKLPTHSVARKRVQNAASIAKFREANPDAVERRHIDKALADVLVDDERLWPILEYVAAVATARLTERHTLVAERMELRIAPAKAAAAVDWREWCATVRDLRARMSVQEAVNLLRHADEADTVDTPLSQPS